jgi:hypothetical protein
MRLDHQKCTKILNYFFLNFSYFFSKLIMFIGCLNAFVKSHDPLIPIKRKITMCYVPFWKKLGKTVKKGNFFWDLLDCQVAFFQKWSIKMSSGFSHCNQCIKRLLLSYQTLPSGNFHFSPCPCPHASK